LRGAQLAAKQINAKGGVLGKTIKIVGVDDKADPAVANMISISQVDYDNLGTSVSSTTLYIIT